MLCARVMRGSSSRANSVTPLRGRLLSANWGEPKGIAHADHDLARAVQAEVGLAGLGIGPGGAHLEHDVGGENGFARGGNLGPFVDILLVGIAGRLAGPGLDQDFEPRLDQQGDRCRDQGHAAFARTSFAGNCNNHGLAEPLGNNRWIK